MRELARAQNESLDREMGILQGLTLRAGPYGFISGEGPELGSAVKREEEESGDEYCLGQTLESGDGPNRPGGSHFLPRKFVPVDDLPLLDPEDPTKRRYAQTEYLDRFGDDRPQNQYFSSGGNVRYSDSRIASEEIHSRTEFHRCRTLGLSWGLVSLWGLLIYPSTAEGESIRREERVGSRM